MIKSLLEEIRGMSLVIVVFAMMVLAVLGWTLAGMISTGFQSYLSGLDSERALGLAEAGIEESVRLIKNNDTAFDQDSDYLFRKLDYGEYNVTRVNATTIINITSTGYVPDIDNYRAMRRVRIAFVGDGGGMNAISGGSLFDWNNTTSISVDGAIVSENFHGTDPNATMNEPEDVHVPVWPSGGDRLVAKALIPAINMTWYYDNSDYNYTGDQDWDWKDAPLTEKQKIIFVNGNVILNTTPKKLDLQDLSIIATGNITIKGNNSSKIRAHVNTKNNIAYPLFATLNGNISTNCGVCSTHEFDGLVYTQNGIINLTNVDTSTGKTMALMGSIIRLNGPVEIICTEKKASMYINIENGFNTTPTNTMLTWQEE